MMTLKKRVFSIIALVLFIVFICPLYILPVSAYNPDFTFELAISQPQISDNNGYIEILFYNMNTNSYFVRTYTWFTNAIGNNVDQTFCEISFTEDYITLAPGYHIYDTTNIGNDIVGARLNYFWYSSTDNSGASAVSQYYGQGSNSLTISIANCKISGVHYYGNFKMLNGFNSPTEFTVLYSGDNVTYDQLYWIYNILYLSNQLEQEQLDVLDALLQSNLTIDEKLLNVMYVVGSIDFGISNLNDKLDQVISNTDDIETKLDKIIEILESNIDTDLPSEVPKDSLNDYNNAEDNLVDSITPSDDIFNDFSPDNFSDFLSGDSFSLTWSLIERAFSTHDYLIIVMSIVVILGVIALILNR